MKAPWPWAWAAVLLGTAVVGAETPYPRSVVPPPGSPEPRYQQLRVSARDGLKLVVHEWSPPEPVAGRPLVLLIHGIGFHGGPYAAVAAGFTTRGLTLVAPDLRGHGRSEGVRGELAEPHVLRADLGAVIDEIAKRHPDCPLILAGESMGGLIATDYAWRGEKRLDGLALLVPAFGVNPACFAGALKPGLTLRGKNWLTGQIPLDTPDNLTASTREPGFIRARKADPLALHEVSFTSYLLRIAGLQAESLRAAGDIKVPLFVAVAGSDRIIDNPSVEKFFAAAGTPKRSKTWRQWDKAYHTLCWDPVTPEVIRELTTWALER